MKKLAFTLFSLFLTIAVFGQIKNNPLKDAAAFEQTPEQNAQQLVDFLKTECKITTDQATLMYDIRLKSAQHVQTLDKAISNGATTVGYQEKRTKIIEEGANKVLNKLTRDQFRTYNHFYGQKSPRAEAVETESDN